MQWFENASHTQSKTNHTTKTKTWEKDETGRWISVVKEERRLQNVFRRRKEEKDRSQEGDKEREEEKRRREAHEDARKERETRRMMQEGGESADEEEFRDELLHQMSVRIGMIHVHHKTFKRHMHQD